MPVKELSFVLGSVLLPREGDVFKSFCPGSSEFCVTLPGLTSPVSYSSPCPQFSKTAQSHLFSDSCGLNPGQVSLTFSADEMKRNKILK